MTHPRTRRHSACTFPSNAPEPLLPGSDSTELQGFADRSWPVLLATVLGGSRGTLAGTRADLQYQRARKIGVSFAIVKQ